MSSLGCLAAHTLCLLITVVSGDRWSREWIFERIRWDKRLDPTMSDRMLAQRYRVSRNTVAKALACPVLAKRRSRRRARACWSL